MKLREMRWKEVPIGQICQVIPGYAFKSKDWRDEGIPVIKIKNIQADRTVDTNGAACVPESIFTERLKKFVLEDGDILLAMTGATAGKVGKLRTDRPMLLNQRVAKIKPIDADPDFIWSLISSDEYQEKFFNLADGAAQPNMSGGQIERLTVNIPDLPTQRRIAGILSAYDDLIENNLRRIKILEEMAQSLYREWFVHFRIPAEVLTKAGLSLDIKLVDSPLGKIPEGWAVKKLGELVEVRKGKNITKKTIREGSVPVVAGGLAPAYFHDTANTNAPVVTISASGANSGFVNIYYENVWASDCSYIDHDATDDVFFYYIQLKSRQADLTRLQRGAAQPHVYPKDIMNLDVIAHDEEFLKHFRERSDPLFQQIRNLLLRNQNLRKTRDLLLPKLLSGK